MIAWPVSQRSRYCIFYCLTRFPTKPLLDRLLLGPFPNEANTGYNIATPVSQRGRDRIYHCMARFPTKPVLHLLLHGPFPNEANTGYSIAWPVSQRSRYWRHPDNQLRNHSITPRRRTTSQPPPHGEVLARAPPRSCGQDHTSHMAQSQVTSHHTEASCPRLLAQDRT